MYPMTENMVPHYTVQSVQDTMVRNDQGLATQGKRVNVRFADGSLAYVEVPFDPQWHERAQQEIEALAEQHRQIMSLQGPMVEAPRRGTIPLTPRQ